jgi:hypothetical protein
MSSDLHLPGFDGTTDDGSPCLCRVLPTLVVPPSVWVPLPASRPDQLLDAARACAAQWLRLRLAVTGPTPTPSDGVQLLEMEASMVSDSDIFFLFTGVWYSEQVSASEGSTVDPAASKYMSSKAKALVALIDSVSLQPAGQQLFVVLLSATAGQPGRLVVLRTGRDADVAAQVQIALAVPLSAASESVVRANVSAQHQATTRAAAQLSCLWGRGVDLGRARTQQQWRLQHIETAKLSLGMGRLTVGNLRRCGVDKDSLLWCLEMADRSWSERRVLLRDHFVCLFAAPATLDSEAVCVFRLDPDTHVVEDFDLGTTKANTAVRAAFSVRSPPGERVVLGADQHTASIWTAELRHTMASRATVFHGGHAFQRDAILSSPPLPPPASEAPTATQAADPDESVIEGLRVTIDSRLRRMCTDVMKSPPPHPEGHDVDAARLVIGQNCLAQGMDELVALRKWLASELPGRPGWIEWVVEAGVPALEEFFGWVQTACAPASPPLLPPLAVSRCSTGRSCRVIPQVSGQSTREVQGGREGSEQKNRPNHCRDAQS